jgi:hypothetical protein
MLKPFQSIIEGIQTVYVHDLGITYGILHLIVCGAANERVFFGVHAPCDAFFAVDEMFYSVKRHGTHEQFLDRTTYIKEAGDSELLRIRRSLAEELGEAGEFRHFVFVGNDYCYEVLGRGEPVIRKFDTFEAAAAWLPTQTPR